MRVLVCDGGGMRSAFTAGVFAGFRDSGIDHSFFDYYVGSSGGACCMAYFLTSQIDEGLRCWSEHLPGKFMKWDGIKPINDTEYLEQIFRTIEPLSCDKIKTAKQKAVVALADPVTLRTEYKILNESEDPVSLLVASAIMPFFSQPAILNGHPYYDENLICAIPLRYTDLLKADEIWVILTQPQGYRRQNWRWQIASLFAGDKQASKLLSHRATVENEVLAEIEARKDLFIIRPEANLPIHWRNDSREAIKATIELGRQATKTALVKL